MAIDPKELVDALKQVDKTVLNELIIGATESEIVKTSKDLGDRARQTAVQIKGLAESFLTNLAKATPEGQQALSARLGTLAKEIASTPSMQLTAQQKAIAVPLIKAVGISAADLA